MKTVEGKASSIERQPVTSVDLRCIRSAVDIPSDVCCTGLEVEGCGGLGAASTAGLGAAAGCSAVSYKVQVYLNLCHNMIDI